MTLTDGREFMSAAALKTEAAEREGEGGMGEDSSQLQKH
jgi:hypothetical protein